ncbi:MAG: ATP-grasp domain-containing protein [Candidatus Dojkabacteria bacterium]|nr:ATP-grasp domain-containing protein [Candidatus Dojkabacteria bacterium]MDQ7021758.1 ATP-grasp domain-containing protein [Candidatus Dojkabacteria bacterium]
MKNILILKSSKASYDDSLAEALNSYKNEDTRITWKYFDQVTFELVDGAISVDVDGLDIKTFNFVYFKIWQKNYLIANALSLVLDHLGINFIDERVRNTHSNNKLKQMVLFSLNKLQIPNTIFPSIQNRTFAYLEEKLGSPFIMKDASGAEGRNNFLVNTELEFESIYSANTKVHFIYQKFIENTGDFRFGVIGDKVCYIKNRIRKDDNTHLNNLSEGASVEYKTISEYEFYNNLSIRVAELLKLNIAGVDLIINEDGKYYILEVNASPAFKNDPSTIKHVINYIESLI